MSGFIIDDQPVITHFTRYLSKIDPRTLICGDRVFIISEDFTQIIHAYIDGDFTLHVGENEKWNMCHINMQVYNVYNNKFNYYVYIMTCNNTIYDTELGMNINTHISCDIDTNITPDLTLSIAKICVKDVVVGDIITESWDSPMFVVNTRYDNNLCMIYLNVGNTEIDYDPLDIITVIRLKLLGG